LGTYRSNEYGNGLGAATLLIHLHGKGPGWNARGYGLPGKDRTAAWKLGFNAIIESEHIYDIRYKSGSDHIVMTELHGKGTAALRN
jgi:hypothetical protein